MASSRELLKPDPIVEAFACQVIGAAMTVHTALGPGLIEAVYKEAMKIELRELRIPFVADKPIEIHYREKLVGRSFADLLVGGVLIVELKAVKSLHEAHMAQALHYLYAGGYKLGLLLNFHEAHMRDGIRRVVANRPRAE